MNIFEFADVIGKDLILRRYENQSGRWTCQFERGEIKDGIFLVGEYGNGQTPDEAIQDYVEKIRGTRIVFSGYGERHEYNVSNTLE